MSARICAEGNVYAWGNNKSKLLGSDVLGVLGTGSSLEIVNAPELVNFPAEALPIKQVDAGSGSHFLALGCNGTVWAWGYNEYGQLGNSDFTSDVITTPVQVMAGEGTDADDDGFLDGVVYVSGGNDQSFAVLATGEVVSWG